MEAEEAGKADKTTTNKTRSKKKKSVFALGTKSFVAGGPPLIFEQRKKKEQNVETKSGSFLQFGRCFAARVAQTRGTRRSGLPSVQRGDRRFRLANRAEGTAAGRRRRGGAGARAGKVSARRPSRLCCRCSGRTKRVGAGKGRRQHRAGQQLHDYRQNQPKLDLTPS